jgi:hypothetical protein
LQRVPLLKKNVQIGFPWFGRKLILRRESIGALFLNIQPWVVSQAQKIINKLFKYKYPVITGIAGYVLC